MSLTPSDYFKVKPGEKAPDFSLPVTDGKTYSLKDFSGKKALLVIFICNHCPFVKPKFSKLIELQAKYGEKGLQIAGICANDAEDYPEDNFENMKKEVKKRGINFVYLRDENQEVAKAYGASCTPDPFLFDAEQKLAYHGRIDDAHGKPHEEAKTNELEEAIQQVLAGKKVSVKAGPSLGCSIKWKKM